MPRLRAAAVTVQRQLTTIATPTVAPSSIAPLTNAAAAVGRRSSAARSAVRPDAS